MATDAGHVLLFTAPSLCGSTSSCSSLSIGDKLFPWVRVGTVRVETVHIDVTVLVCMLFICLGCKGLYE